MVGADNLQGITGWRDAPRILSEYGVVAYPRRGYDLEALRRGLLDRCRNFPAPYVLDSSSIYPDPGSISLEDLGSMYHIEIIDAPIIDISSTEIRERQAAGEDMSEYLM